jgi:hypothetical protein
VNDGDPLEYQHAAIRSVGEDAFCNARTSGVDATQVYVDTFPGVTVTYAGYDDVS